MKLTSLVLALSLFAISCSNEKTERPPNIIHIFADDLGYGDISSFGATDIATPNIDRLANEGIKFTDFYSAAHVCSPSRAALMTGRLPQRMGIHGVFFPESYTGMPEDEETIAEKLKEKNYATGIVGKWHLGHMRKFLPLQQGFDSYFGIPYSNDMESVVYLDGNDVVNFDVDQHYTTKTYTEKAIDFIETHKAEPFFLYLPHNMPHVPLYVSEDFEGTSNRGLYGDVIQEIDWSVGEILNKLEQDGLLENTLVIFSSDNGPWLVMEDHGGSAGHLREGKQFTFDGGMRVPTLAMWKGKIEAGQVYEGLASQMDWFPTIMNLVGITLDPERAIDGEDLTDVLLNKGQRASDEYLFFDGAQAQAFRKGDWKIKLPYEGFKGAGYKSAVAPHDTLLVNIKNNPEEDVNLFRSNREKGLELIAQMKKAHDALGELPAAQVLRTSADNSHYAHVQELLKNRIKN
ncbi:sulfatase family protein [Arcticibacterium luteifluviistationis]|uniref:N-acetylgalactosamine-6-sulfatase n=1 Tax=Arcticibacterium luteifluviistationis TaxID=1784714 RepID=A0A2Z4GIM4_9BACT|nr:sulfatase [Arcticibacterium luteifluviistationis]AWW00734.1 N-acetylgalactosamine-6-sulfatase [Arcticibacterium luteifluviistationis]